MLNDLGFVSNYLLVIGYICLLANILKNGRNSNRYFLPYDDPK